MIVPFSVENKFIFYFKKLIKFSNAFNVNSFKQKLCEPYKLFMLKKIKILKKNII